VAQEKSTFTDYVILIIIIIIVLFPVAYMLLIALTPHEDLFVTLLPLRLTVHNFIDVLSDKVLVRVFINSCVISLSTALLSLVLASLAGYGLSRFRFKGKIFVILFVLLTQMLPMELLAISYFRIIERIGLYNTRIVLVLLDATLSVPFCTLMLKSIIDSIPKEIEEAALIDGCSKIHTFFRIVIPLSWAGLLAAAFFAFLNAWIEYLYGLTFTSDYRAMPMTVKLATLIGHYIISWEKMMAMSFLFSIPILLLFGFTQHIFIKGLTTGAVKG